MADLPGGLHRWALKEMHFHPQGLHVNTPLPSADDFREICVGPMADVWNFVLQYVRSAQTVRKIQGNLALKSRQLTTTEDYKVKYGSKETFSQEKADLLQKRKSLMSELTTSLASIGHLEKDLDRLRAELSRTEAMYQTSSRHIHELRQRSTLLKANTWRLEEEVAKCNEFTGKLSSKVSQHTEKLNKPSDTQYLASGRSSSETRLETACSKQVRQDLQMFQGFLEQLVKGDFTNDPNLRQKKKEELWHAAESTINSYPAGDVVAALTSNTLEATLALKEKTANVDIAKDADKLKFHFEAGRLRDVSMQPSTLHSVHQLLMGNQSAHVRQFLETEDHLNQTHKLQERLKQANDIIHGHIERTYRDDPGAQELAKKIYSTELHSSANKAALRTLEEETAVLREQISQAAQEKERLYAKYQKIQDFHTLTEKKQDLIRVLVKRNTLAKSSLDSHQMQVQKYVQSALGEHESTIMALVHKTTDCVSAEVDKFAKLPLSFLMYTQLLNASRVPVLELSIHRLQGHQGPQAEVIKKVLQAMEFPDYKAPECLLPAVMTLLQEASDLDMTLRTQASVAAGLESHESEQSSLIQRVAELCSQMQDQDTEQLSSTLPQLQKLLSQYSQALGNCLKLRDTAQAWWEQPGQAVVPWMKVDDRPLRHWKDRWTVAVTRLRQHQS